MPDTDGGRFELVWARSFADVGRKLALARPEDVLGTIALMATQFTRCTWAAITRRTDDEPTVAATSDPDIADRIAGLQAAAGGGPTWQAIRETTTIYVPNLVDERRWPEHIKVLLDTTPVRSLLAIALHLDGDELGAMTMYADRIDAFPHDTVEVAEILAAHAAIALDRASVGARAHNLEQALETNRIIGVAIGVLVERHKITNEQAFDLLRLASQHRHTKLRDIAEHIAETGEFGV